MQYRQLGTTDIQVSALCLGTMTFGEQNSEAESHAQLDQALVAGINFIDTAEIYPVPSQQKTQGLTEAFIGSWLNQRRCRDQVILATKVCGPADWLPYMRGGQTRLNRQHIVAALEASLLRLQTEVIDLYQLHWPDRSTNYFGQLGYQHQTGEQSIPLEETLEALHQLVQAGKIRFIGVSNETPWGVMNYLQLAQQAGLPRIVSIQNPYNLLNRTFEIGLAEIAIREQCGLLAYSPLAFGRLSGKYLQGTPENARLTLYPNSRFTRYSNPESEWATRAYVELAQEFNLSPAQMALAWVTSRPFVTANIIGATTLDQLRTNLNSIDLVLSDAVLTRIEQIHQQQPNPAP